MKTKLNAKISQRQRDRTAIMESGIYKYIIRETLEIRNSHTETSAYKSTKYINTCKDRYRQRQIQTKADNDSSGGKPKNNPA